MKPVTRSMEATSAQPAAAVAQSRRALPNGWWGVALLICTEASLIGTLIATYFYLRFKTPVWPPHGSELPELAKPCALTGGLVTTSVLMVFATRSARAGLALRTGLLMLGALAIQSGYLAFQLDSYVSSIHRDPPSDSAYSSIYHLLLGTDHAHVFVGMLLIIGLLLKLTRGLTNYRVVGVRAVTLYWHFTNAATVAVLLTQIYPSL